MNIIVQKITNHRIFLKVLLAEMTENETLIAKNMTVNGQKIGYVTKISSKLLTVWGLLENIEAN